MVVNVLGAAAVEHSVNLNVRNKLVVGNRYYCYYVLRKKYFEFYLHIQ